MGAVMRIAKRIALGAATAGLALMGPALAQQGQESQCEAGRCIKYVTVKAGKSAILAPGISYVAKPPSCDFIQPNIQTIKAPTQGKVVPKIVSRSVGERSSFGQATGCSGKPTKGLQLIYVANSNARGSDEVVITATAGGAPTQARYVITIDP
jgi:hypothetical protein